MDHVEIVRGIDISTLPVFFNVSVKGFDRDCKYAHYIHSVQSQVKFRGNFESELESAKFLVY